MKKFVFFIICFLIFFNECSANTRFGYDKDTSTLSLHFENHHGIGNRLKKMVSYIRYYKPRNLNLYWTASGWVSAKFLDLFELKISANVSEINNKNLINDNKEANPLFKYVRGWGLIVAKNDFKTVEPFSIDRQYNNIPKEIIDIYVPFFKAIRPSKQVLQRISTVKLNRNIVTVQVRNHHDYKKWFGGNEKLETFFRAMDKYPSNTLFFISAMSKEVASKFYERYPNRVFELPNKNYNSMIDAVADMYILGSTDETLCSYMSTFCEVGWWLNGANSKVTVIGNGESFTRKADTLEIIDYIE